MEKEYLILKDQDGRTIKVSEEDYRENIELFQDIEIANEVLPNWIHKYKKGVNKSNDC